MRQEATGETIAWMEQGLNKGRPILDGWMLLCVRCKDHQCTVLIFQTEKPAHDMNIQE